MVARNAQDQLNAQRFLRTKELKHGVVFLAKERAEATNPRLEEKEEENMKIESVKLLPPSFAGDEIALVACLKACAQQRDLYKGSALHVDIVNKGLLQKNHFIGNALINMYAKCGALAKAEHVFEALPVRDVVAWNALISGYAQQGHGRYALYCFDRMQYEGLCPNSVTFVGLLKACGSIQAAEKGEELHAKIEKKGYLGHGTILGNAVLDMYAKCGALAKAQRLFNQLSVRNVVSWTALITGYSQHGHGEEALKFFEQMKSEGLFPNAITFACILGACGSINASEIGKEIHSDIARKGLLEPGSALSYSLMDMYAKCGALAKAQEVFDSLVARDVTIWSKLIAGYCQHGLAEKALEIFERMQLDGVSANAMTVACVLTCCGSKRVLNKGKEVHSESIEKGFLEGDTVLGNALVDMYAKCGALVEAQQVFDKLPVRDVVSWSALIAGFCHHERGEEALCYLEQMQHKGLMPDALTFACILQACSTLKAVKQGMELHCEIARKGLLANNIVLGSSIVDLYAKCGVLAKAQEVFDLLPARNLISWSVLIAGYCLHGLHNEALKCFEQMKGECISPDAVTLACTLKACGSVGAADKGVEIHGEIDRMGLLEADTVLNSALVGMYAKCGLLAKAQEVFDKLSSKDVVLWSVLITGYSEHGHANEALNCFEDMKHQGITPDEVSFTCVLAACGSIGACENGQMYFEAMSASFGIIPTLQHHTCMAVLYSRIGQLDKSIAVIRKIPSPHYPPLLRSLLAACQRWGNATLGSLAFEHALQEDSPWYSTLTCMKAPDQPIGFIEDKKASIVLNRQ